MSEAPDALTAFFTDAADEFRTAASLVGTVERDLVIAGRRLRLRFAGTELPEVLLPALAPRLSPPAARPHAEIELWDQRALGGRHVRVPWRDQHLEARGLLRIPGNDRIQGVHEVTSGALTLIDRETRCLLHRVPDAGSVPWWERAAPLRPALLGALGGPDRALVHAGAVGDSRGAVLLAGPGGVGKTTLALAGLEAGMSYVADDYLLLERADGFMAWNLFATAKLDPGHLERFPVLGPAAKPLGDDPQEKAVLFVSEERPSQLTQSLPVRAVIVPRIGPGPASLRTTGRAEAMLALAPSTVFQMPYDGGAVIGLLSQVARELPCFALKVGDEPDELAPLITEALELGVRELGGKPLTADLAS